MTAERAVILAKKVTCFREFGYLNSSCIRKRIILMFLSSPCWWPWRSGWTPSCCLHTNHYQSCQKISLEILLKKNCCDLNLGKSLCIFAFLFSQILDFIKSILKSLVILAMWLALSGAICSQITLSFAVNCIFFSANENGTVKQNNQSDLKTFLN